MIGQTVSHYQILEKLGEGGMGQVFRARDTRLSRFVAIKALPPEKVADPERRARFVHEARAASALNHANIVTVHDILTEDGRDFIVMEYVAGETLAAKIARQDLRYRETLRYATQIADALARAHAAGILHRDVKPSNIMISEDGAVKLLDFGLAKLAPRVPQADDSTVTRPETREGFVVGTSGYMSPEQVRGQEIDHRSDIFSFGVVLYEMLSGKPAFKTDSGMATMTAILRDDPPELSDSVPPGLDQIVRHCLEKEAGRRFQSSQDLAFALQSLAGSSSAAAPALPAAGPTRIRRFIWPVAAAALALATVLLTLFVLLQRPASDLAAYRFTPFATDAEPESQAAWSPDGRSIAYIKGAGRNAQIFVRSLEQDTPVQVTRMPQAASAPFWSPESSRIWFLSAGHVWSVGRAGGDPELVQKDVLAADLSPDGKTLAVWKVTTEMGQVTSCVWLASPPNAELRKYSPATIEVTSWYLGTHLRFSPDGSEILAAFRMFPSIALWRLPFPDGTAARGKPQRIFAAANSWLTVPQFAWLPDNRRVIMAFRSTVDAPPRLWTADIRKETLRPLSAGAASEGWPAVSPDGSKIVYTVGEPDHDLVEVPLDGGPVRELMTTSRNEHYAAWSPVAAQFAYVTDRSGEDEIRLRSRTEGWDRALVTQRDFPNDPTRSLCGPVFSPDGGRIAYHRLPVKGDCAVWISPLAGGPPARLMQATAYHNTPAWSPDGRWIVFRLMDAGIMKLAKSRLGSSEPPVILFDRECLVTPSWSPAGGWITCQLKDELIVVSSDGKSKRSFPKVVGLAHVWSRDGSTVYTISDSEQGFRLIRVDVMTGTQKTGSDLGTNLVFRESVPTSMRFSLAPDGKSFASPVLRERTDLWLLEGFNRGWRGR